MTALRIAFLVTLAGCNWGTRLEDVPLVRSPAGATVTYRLHAESARPTAELIAVDSIGMTVLAARLTRIAWNRIAMVDVHHFGRGYDLAANAFAGDGRRQPTTAWFDRVSLLARFPQGMSPHVLTQLLRRLNQESLDEVQ